MLEKRGKKQLPLLLGVCDKNTRAWCLYAVPSPATRCPGGRCSGRHSAPQATAKPVCSQVPPSLRKSLGWWQKNAAYFCSYVVPLEQIYSIWIMSWISSEIMRLSVPFVCHLSFTSLVWWHQEYFLTGNRSFHIQ